MGYGPVKNGRQGVITPYKGSWAEQMSRDKPIGWTDEMETPQQRKVRIPNVNLQPSKHQGGVSK